MLNSLSTRKSLIIINLLALFTSGVAWKSIKKNVPQKFLESPVNCNPHNYAMMLDSPVFCNNEAVFLLVLVRSIPGHSLRRQSIRHTWGSLNEVKEKTVKVAFLFGNNTPDFNDIIQNEHAAYQDILQESFPESYKTLDLKTVMAWKWTLTTCPNATFVIVCNDEVFVDIFKTVSYLKKLIETKQHEGFYGCYLGYEGNRPKRNLTHKQGVSWTDYPGNHYPAFCNGNGYIASQLIIRKLYEMSLNTPSFMPDDVWTGVLSAKLGLVISHIRKEVAIGANFKLIQQYESFGQYAQVNALLFPLDRLYTKCEMCMIDYLWPRIMHYNNPLTILKWPSKTIFHNKYLILVLVSFSITLALLRYKSVLIKRKRLLFSTIGIILLLTILFQIYRG